MIEEIDFIMPCPVFNCSNGSKPIRWAHSKCGGFEKINDKGFIRCLLCSKSAILFDWSFKCENHNFLQGSFQSILNSLSIMGKLKSDSDIEDFILDLSDNISREYRKKKKEKKQQSTTTI